MRNRPGFFARFFRSRSFIVLVVLVIGATLYALDVYELFKGRSGKVGYTTFVNEERRLETDLVCGEFRFETAGRYITDFVDQDVAELVKSIYVQNRAQLDEPGPISWYESVPRTIQVVCRTDGLEDGKETVVVRYRVLSDDGRVTRNDFRLEVRRP